MTLACFVIGWMVLGGFIGGCVGALTFSMLATGKAEDEQRESYVRYPGQQVTPIRREDRQHEDDGA